MRTAPVPASKIHCIARAERSEPFRVSHRYTIRFACHGGTNKDRIRKLLLIVGNLLRTPFERKLFVTSHILNHAELIGHGELHPFSQRKKDRTTTSSRANRQISQPRVGDIAIHAHNHLAIEPTATAKSRSFPGEIICGDLPEAVQEPNRRQMQQLRLSRYSIKPHPCHITYFTSVKGEVIDCFPPLQTKGR